MKILAIETSCDETAISVLSGQGDSLVLEKNVIYSQIDIHKKFGGVVPEVAARKHLETIAPLLENTLGKNRLKDIDYLAVTAGPGLVTSLILGVVSSKTLAYVSELPLLPINHIEGHIYSNLLSNKISKKHFPALVLVVSGGHTEIILMKDHGDYQLLGQTLDDAVGEAYDKVAKLLDLGYPGGPIVSRLAAKGDDQAYHLPRPMLDSQDYNFSLSGLKTAVLYALEKQKNISQKDVANMCACFQKAVIDVLLAKTIKAAQEYQVKSIMIAGGVSANAELKKSLAAAAEKINLPFFYPELQFTGDNAAMIAAAAYYKIKSKKAKPLTGKNIFSLEPEANWQLVKNNV
ncbi:tRNA (adenosine(37)-N6)-threonylcarbamoyltransferase complex transferase subunit TsaD [Candidatus Parcubacteria bacterium]|nr:MAG: tRNA (adenosine(37)-N6)-threonylcarbamoyltransferase complex transferase subunit TsaD [Candidatus Parcubacteria bacterium]